MQFIYFRSVDSVNSVHTKTFRAYFGQRLTFGAMHMFILLLYLFLSYFLVHSNFLSISRAVILNYCLRGVNITLLLA